MPCPGPDSFLAAEKHPAASLWQGGRWLEAWLGPLLRLRVEEPGLALAMSLGLPHYSRE